ncbi:MAG: hypothetical protein U0326_06365 [Polyangiales bacterium]
MILIVTEQSDLTADLVIRALSARNAPVLRLNCERLLGDVEVQCLYPGDCSTLRTEDGRKVPLTNIRSVWYRRPALPTANPALAPPFQQFAQREAWAHTLGVLLSLDAAWMSDPMAVWRANHKAFQLALASRMGFHVPRSCITRSVAEASAFASAIKGPVVAKPVTYGSVEDGDRELAIYTTRLPVGPPTPAFEGIELSPVILQEEVAKNADLRVTVVGTKVFAVAIDSQARPETRVDWRRPTDGRLAHTPVLLPTALEEQILAFVGRLGLEYAALDFVERTDGSHTFLEINPNGQWGWLQQETGLDIAGAVADRLIAMGAR